LKRDARGRFVRKSRRVPGRRDDFGRFARPDAPHLEPYRDEETGRFAPHPVKALADDLHEGRLSRDAFMELSEEYGLTTREIWALYDLAVG